MVPLNFKLSKSIYVLSGDLELDLHNDYDLKEVVAREGDNVCHIKLTRNDAPHVDASNPAEIVFEITGVESYREESGREDASELDKQTLEEIAFWTNEDWCTSPFVTEEIDPEWEWIFMLESDHWYRIKARDIKLILPNNSW